MALRVVMADAEIDVVVAEWEEVLVPLGFEAHMVVNVLLDVSR